MNRTPPQGPLIDMPARQSQSQSPTKTTTDSLSVKQRLDHLAATHPYSSAFLLGSSLTVVFIASIGLTKAVLAPGSALTARQVNATWHARYESLHAASIAQARLVAQTEASSVARMKRLEDKIEDLAQKLEAAGKVAPAVTAFEKLYTTPLRPPPHSASASPPPSPPPVAPPSKRSQQPYYGIRMGIGKLGPMPIVTADNPNYITFAESNANK